MSFLSVLLNWFLTDIRTTLISLTIGFTVYKISKFYYKVFTYPPGPTPLPVIGNILEFRVKDHCEIVLAKLNAKYGPIFTLWMGTKPLIIVTDIDIARDTFKKNDFSGRQESYFGGMLSNDKHQDVIFTDYGPQWEALRKVAHSAAQKYSVNEKFVNLANDTVDKITMMMIKKEGENKPFNPSTYTYFLFLNILGNSAFGENYDIEDPEFKHLKYVLKDLQREVGPRFLLWEFSSMIRLYDRTMVKKHRELFRGIVDMVEEKFVSHTKDYDPSVERDFCDALIAAKKEALKEGKGSALYLTDINLAVVILDLFFAGTDTSQQTFQWILLLIAYYPDVQKNLRQEIESEIGDRMPSNEDRNRCHYVMAFISETLRLRNVAPFGLPHKSVVTSKIGNYTIPEGNGIFVYQGLILKDKNQWTDPHVFRPERFIENGKYLSTRSKAFIPFGVGRRVCLGEKLAIADLFLVLVRFLQKTFDYDIVLDKNNGIEPDPNVADSIAPKPYHIVLKTK